MTFRRRKKPTDELPTSIRLKAELRNFLIDEAQRQDLSLNWVINDILHTWMTYQIKAREEVPRALRIRK